MKIALRFSSTSLPLLHKSNWQHTSVTNFGVCNKTQDMSGIFFSFGWKFQWIRASAQYLTCNSLPQNLHDNRTWPKQAWFWLRNEKEWSGNQEFRWEEFLSLQLDLSLLSSITVNFCWLLIIRKSCKKSELQENLFYPLQMKTHLSGHTWLLHSVPIMCGSVESFSENHEVRGFEPSNEMLPTP